MKAIRPGTLLLFAVVACALGWVANVWAVSAGIAALRLPLTALFSMGFMCLISLWLGWSVKRSRDGKTARMDPLLAARTLVLGQACSHVGALLAGWHAGILLSRAQALASGVASATTSESLAIIFGGIVMVASGIAVERFCRIPPEDGEQNPPQAEPQPQP